MELCSCRQWAVNLDRSKAKPRKMRQDCLEEEPHIGSPPLLGGEKTHTTSAARNFLSFHLFLNVCDLPWQCI